MTKADTEVQRLEGDAIVSLYIIDTTPIGGDQVIRFTTMPNGMEPLLHDGSAYYPVDCEVDGFEWDGRGSFPRPRLKIANIDGIVTNIINGIGDIVGSKFYRIRTFAKFLDTGATPDATAIFPPEIFTVNQRTSQNKRAVEWELSSAMDHLGVMLPRRIVIRDVCTHRYRIFDEEKGVFDYKGATCPYAGTNYFDENGEPISGTGNAAKAQDKCGRTLADCRKRFGQNGVLPTRAFPGVGKIRQ